MREVVFEGSVAVFECVSGSGQLESQLVESPEPCCTSDWGRQKKQALCVDGKERREASFFTALFSCSPQEAAAIGSSLSRQTSTFTHTHTHTRCLPP